MKRWYKVVDGLTLKDGSVVKEDRLVFETTDKELSKRVEKFFQSLMDETETVPLNTPLKISDYNIEAIYSTREDSVFVITKIEPQLRNCASDSEVIRWKRPSHYKPEVVTERSE